MPYDVIGVAVKMMGSATGRIDPAVVALGRHNGEARTGELQQEAPARHCWESRCRPMGKRST